MRGPRVLADLTTLSWSRSHWERPHPGKVVADLAAAVALGGDCAADIAVLREQPQLAGPVASDPVVCCLVSTCGRPAQGAAGHPVRPCRSPGAGLGRCRGCRPGRRRRPCHHRPGLDHRGGALRRGTGRAYLEGDLRLPSHDRLGRPRRGGNWEPLAIVLRPGNLPFSDFAKNQLWCEVVAQPHQRHLRPPRRSHERSRLVGDDGPEPDLVPRGLEDRF
jgi:hypothetical protein